MSKNPKIILVTVDMGYGHQRTAYPLRSFAFGNGAINANNYKGMLKSDRRVWETTRRFYEFISDFKKIPILGPVFFYFFDSFQKIPAFYPKRDLSKPNINLMINYGAIKRGWGKDLVEKLEEISRKEGGDKPMPIVSTFYTPAFMAEYHNYPGQIYCIVCDADVSRSWVPMRPRESRIKYLVPNTWVRNRLRLYGVREENIFLSGYPLPMENIEKPGEDNLETIKEDLKKRLINLDPLNQYRDKYEFIIKKYLGKMPESSGRKLTILFSIGGAGAQKELVIEYLKGLKKKILNKEIKVIISVGVRKTAKVFFEKYLRKNGFGKSIGENIEFLYREDINDYFDEFDKCLRKTDILWTKPSELSFYSGLGIPIIMAPTVGSQEDFNKRWLLWLGIGINQENPKYVNDWLFDYINGGRLAEAALEGFIEVEKMAVENIKRVCLG